MEFPTPLIPGRLIRRYKRFLADVLLEDGREVVAHCPNPGSMLGLADPGQRIWVEPNDDPKKKLKFGWRLVELPTGMVGIDTSLPNKIVAHALERQEIAAFAAYSACRKEVPYGNGSRVDFVLSGGGPDLYLEVKSVTLSREPGRAEFPDSVTARGARHLAELSKIAADDQRAALLYVVQRSDCDHVCVARDLDPGYAQALDDARAAGVQVISLGTTITPASVALAGPMPVKDGVANPRNCT